MKSNNNKILLRLAISAEGNRDELIERYKNHGALDEVDWDFYTISDYFAAINIYFEKLEDFFVSVFSYMVLFLTTICFPYKIFPSTYFIL